MLIKKINHIIVILLLCNFPAEVSISLSIDNPKAQSFLKIFEDNFDDWVPSWEEISGNWSFYNGYYICNSSSNEISLTNAGNFSWSNYRFTCHIRIGKVDDSGGLIFYANNISSGDIEADYYFLEFADYNDTVALWKISSDDKAVLLANTTFILTNHLLYNFTLTIQDTSITVDAGGSL
ncbi:MAG: hypothetical protein ACXABK_02560, partial [Candidatus Heimdallarchaeaceae archaeon]